MIVSIAVWLGWCSLSLPAQAHPLNNGYLEITIDGRTASCELFLPAADLPFLDRNGDKRITEDELAAGQTGLSDYIKRHMELLQDDELLAFRFVSAAPSDKEGIAGVDMRLEFTSQYAIDHLTIHYTLLFDDVDPQHVNFVTIMRGDDLDQAVMDAGNRTYQYEALGGGGMAGTLLQYVWLGMTHIWTGYDHMLFLLSLLVTAARWRDALRIVTAFTAAHSVTLLLTATGTIHVNARWVETGIALTISYVAAENWFVRKQPNRLRYRWLLTFAFGLVHGMGFAGALQETGLPSRYFISSLLSFNAGVEIGQLAVVAALLPFLLRSRSRRWYSPFALGVSAAVFALGIVWAVMRAF
jgi:hydrogenase/urease accessory protein HupE